MTFVRAIRAGLSALAAVMALPEAGEALTLKPGTLWPSADVPVCWESTDRERRQERDLVRKSIRWTWERESAVRFVGWRKCAPGDNAVRLTFEGSYPRTEGRGRELAGIEGGVKLPTLWSLAALSINMKAPVHEFGHVLGFGHEYARADVADFARCGALLDGVPYVEDDRALTPYDEQSIMVGCRPGATARFSSGVPSLSAGDIFGLVRAYGSHPDNVLDANEAGDRFGAGLDVRDMDGDGVPDLAVLAPGEDDGAGATYLYRGDRVKGFRPWRRAAEADRTASPPATVQQPDLPPLPRFARDLALTPDAPLHGLRADLDGDGIEDMVAGLPEARIDGVPSGAVVVLRGIPGGGLAEWYWFGQSH